MNRRRFIAGLGTVAAANLTTVAEPRAAASADPAGAATAENVWLPWDLWHLEAAHDVEHAQGRPRWIEDAVYADHVDDGLASWPTVYRDEASGKWRMFHSSQWKPYRLHVAESDDGVHFRPTTVRDVAPEDGQVAPNHVFTLSHGSAGAVYVDPVAADGYRFKAFAHRQQDPVFARAKDDPTHRWHAIAKEGKSQRYFNEELLLVSRDGLRWEVRLDRSWGLPDWHPEPPIFGFYNPRTGRHAMTVRPGWGDRRVCLQTTTDFRAWSGPEMLLHPDPLDGLTEHYGMPVFPYGGGFVGFPWIFHCVNTQATGFNRFIGGLDAQLAYSYDGVRFHRGLRRPFVERNEPGRPGGGAVQPSCLVEAGDELRIFSASSKVQHGRRVAAREAGETATGAVLVHTLRRDGFMLLRNAGGWGEMLTKPLALFDATLRTNVRAPHGEMQWQVTDLERRPVEGYTFADFMPLERIDGVELPLRWKDRTLEPLLNRVVRLHMRLRDAEFYALRGRFHFLDAQDAWMLADGRTIDTRRFDH